MIANLIYKIGGDINPFKKSLDGARVEAKNAGKSMGDQFGKEFGTQAKGILMSVIGGGAIVGLFRKELEEAKKIAKEQGRTGLGSKEVQVLERISERTGLSTDEILARGKVNPKAFETLVRTTEAEGGFRSDQQVATNVKRDEAMRRFGRAIGGGVAGATDWMIGSLNQVAGKTAAGVAGMMPEGENQQRMIRASMALESEARSVAERFVGLPPGEKRSDQVVAAIRELHKTVAEKL